MFVDLQAFPDLLFLDVLILLCLSHPGSLPSLSKSLHACNYYFQFVWGIAVTAFRGQVESI